MALFIISRRPGEADFSYRNRCTAENAEVNGHSGAGRRLAYERLRIRLEQMMMRWQSSEPETEFRLMDTGVEGDDRFDVAKESGTAKKKPSLGVYATDAGFGVFIELDGVKAGDPISDGHPTSDDAHAARRRYQRADAPDRVRL